MWQTHSTRLPVGEVIRIAVRELSASALALAQLVAPSATT